MRVQPGPWASRGSGTQCHWGSTHREQQGTGSRGAAREDRVQLHQGQGAQVTAGARVWLGDKAQPACPRPCCALRARGEGEQLSQGGDTQRHGHTARPRWWASEGTGCRSAGAASPGAQAQARRGRSRQMHSSAEAGWQGPSPLPPSRATAPHSALVRVVPSCPLGTPASQSSKQNVRATESLPPDNQRGGK